MPRDPSDRDDPYYPAPVLKGGPFMTRESSWLVERDNVLDYYFPAIFNPRHPHSLLNKLRMRRLYPQIDPPEISSTAERIFSGSATITLSTDQPGGEIFYTLDGSDPRELPRGQHVSLVPEDAKKRVLLPTDSRWDRGRVTWRDLAFDDSAWPQGTGGAGYEGNAGGDYAELIDPKLNVVRSVTPSGNESIYLRCHFDVDDPRDLARLFLRVRYDDGFVAYINGREVARSNVRGRPVWNSIASDRHADTASVEYETFETSALLSSLRKGRNVLAVHALNDDPGSSDLLIHPILEGIKRIEPRAMRKGVSRYEKPIELTGGTTVRASVKLGGQWSALVTKSFLTVVPASKKNVVLSEIMYHPKEDGAAEFVELCNVSTNTAIDLSGVQLGDAIEFTFSKATLLAPGECLVVARDVNAFREAHGDRPAAPIAYRNSLSNHQDTVVLRAADGTIIETVAYGDDSPWPSVADGEGSSLERRVSDAESDPSSPECWEASAYEAGSPGEWRRFE